MFLRPALSWIAAAVLLAPAIGLAQSPNGYEYQGGQTARQPVRSVYHKTYAYRVATGHGGFGAQCGCEAQTLQSPYVNFDGCASCGGGCRGVIPGVLADVDEALSNLLFCAPKCGHGCGKHRHHARPDCGCDVCCRRPLRECADKLLSLFRCNGCCSGCGSATCGGCGVENVLPEPIQDRYRQSPFLDDPDAPPQPPVDESAKRYVPVPYSSYPRAKQLWPELQPPVPARTMSAPVASGTQRVKRASYEVSDRDGAATSSAPIVTPDTAVRPKPESAAAAIRVSVQQAPSLAPIRQTQIPQNPLRDQ